MKILNMNTMVLKRYFLNKQGFSLIELIVVMVIAAILIVAGGISMKPALARRNVRDCGTNMISDIQLIRSYAQSEGHRAVFQLTNTAKAEDIDGDGLSEYYIGFLDMNSNGVHESGDTILIHGTGGDELCSSRVSVDNTTLPSGRIIFDPLGLVMSGAANRNIFLTASGTATRIEMVSLAGMLRYYINTDDCGGDGCTVGDLWEEL
ncbi:MAG: hypothetical protein DRP47_11695 [Candidatus Zixiibacteriota bacterium]|nr:MAG: hypothetical protein DRP47_11695 [candidate division Zixibacteria bacterium]